MRSSVSHVRNPRPGLCWCSLIYTLFGPHIKPQENTINSQRGLHTILLLYEGTQCKMFASNFCSYVCLGGCSRAMGLGNFQCRSVVLMWMLSFCD